MTRRTATNVRTHLEDTRNVLQGVLQKLSAGMELTTSDLSAMWRVKEMSECILRLNTDKVRDIYVERRAV